MPDSGKNQSSTRDLVRLVRFLLSAGDACLCSAAPDETITVRKTDGTEKTFSGQSLQQALTFGLVACEKGTVRCRPEARTFLKRALGPDGDMHWQGQHAPIVPLQIGKTPEPRPVRLNLEDSPLSALARLKDRQGKGFFPAEAIAAGNRLHADFMRAQLQPHITQSFSPRVDGGLKAHNADLNDSALSARQRFNRAVLAMGPELQGVAVDICCFAKGLETVEQERGWPQRSAKLMLRTALMLLSRHYHPPVPPARSRMQHWGSEDYRPDLR
jgi:hypothetical protein